MLIKTGDAEILNVVNEDDINDEKKRKNVLASALEDAKKLIGKSQSKDSENKTES